MTKYKKLMARVLTLIMILSLVFPFIAEDNIQGKTKRPKLSASNLTIKVKKSKTISVKNEKKAKFKWKSKNRKYATVKSTGKGKAKITGVRKGNTKITCKVIIKNKKPRTLTCKIKVTAARKSSTPNSATKAPTPTAKVTPPTATPTATVIPTPEPTPEPKPLYSPNTEDDPATLKGAYTSFFENVGTCLSSYQLGDANTLNFVKQQYNSFTLENEMKPNSILSTTGWGPNATLTTITKEQAMGNGYVIPENYSESNVPSLRFTTLDSVLKIAYENNLRMRAHTLVWHSQTPISFFRENFSSSANTPFVSKEVMDARMEFYIRSVMKHVYDSEYGSVVYAWDVVNEYLNADSTNWVAIYGKKNTNPDFVKKAFEISYDVLKQYNLQDDVGLFYNDYNTYYNSDDIVTMIKYINKDEKVCDGIGMQAHLDVDAPTVDFIEKAVDKFIRAGFEIQITELDVTINYMHGQITDKGRTNEEQAQYMGDLMKMLIEKRAAGANVTGLTWWGLYDNISWRGPNTDAKSYPLLFGTSINDPKPSFNAVISAAADYWNSQK